MLSPSDIKGMTRDATDEEILAEIRQRVQMWEDFDKRLGQHPQSGHAVRFLLKKMDALEERLGKAEEALERISEDGQAICGFSSTKETLEAVADMNGKIKVAQDALKSLSPPNPEK